MLENKGIHCKTSTMLSSNDADPSRQRARTGMANTNNTNTANNTYSPPFDPDLTTILQNVFRIDFSNSNSNTNQQQQQGRSDRSLDHRHHPVAVALRDAHIHTWDGFRALAAVEIRQLTTPTPCGSPSTSNSPRIRLVNNLEKQLLVLREFAIHHDNDNDHEDYTDSTTTTRNKQHNIAEVYTHKNFSRFRRAQNEGYPPNFWIPNTVSVNANINIPNDNVNDNYNGSVGVGVGPPSSSTASTVSSDWY